ncbi:hypothetical protein HW090_15495 [Pseudomonas sp. ABC1]|uniref:DUF6162 family protein n=1 Tax=Pseudomonas sp. ABC1 TaxID=2748080 RepID=UPI0015C38873|nr:DUF6162 family protein [Pseudomonas sp. ABC1]QLF94524.1 hypothetical protein HW090_15495 [Pseudomonas sp. ABC1]
MTVQVVRPAGAGHETLYVLLFCLCILVLAGLFIGWQASDETNETLAAHQVDARRDLTSAEQGIYTDLRVAHEEILIRQEEEGLLPQPDTLADEGFPPFTQDTSHQTRGAHHWQLAEVDGQLAYLGRSESVDVAGSFLMLTDEVSATESDIWLNRANTPELPPHLSSDTLIATGWKQIATRFDAGVTRKQHAH